MDIVAGYRQKLSLDLRKIIVDYGVEIGGPSRPKSGAAIDSAPLQDDGTFFIRAAPGRNLVYVPWARASELSSASVDVAEGETITVELKVSEKPDQQENERRDK
jgi:hypothetical protein